MQKEHLVEILRGDWALEMDGAAMYAALAKKDGILDSKQIFQKLSTLQK